MKWLHRLCYHGLLRFRARRGIASAYKLPSKGYLGFSGQMCTKCNKFISVEEKPSVISKAQTIEYIARLTPEDPGPKMTHSELNRVGLVWAGANEFNMQSITGGRDNF